MSESAPIKKKISQRTIIISAVAVVLILVIMFAYVAPELMKPPTPPAVKPKEKVLVVGTSDYLWGIDPYDMRGYIAHMVSSMIYDTPTRIEMTKEGWEVKPNLALKWDVADGKGVVWDFELRKDVLFHDGTPFNASAVKFAYERTIGGKKGEYNLLGDYVKSVEVLDTYKVRFTLYEQFSGFPSVTVNSLASVVSPTAVKKWGEQYSTKSLVGTGPFKFESWIPGDQIILVKNDKYWNKDRIPKIDRFILKFFKDPSTLKLALEKKEIDVVHRNLLTSDIPALEKNTALNVYRGPQTFVRMLCVNPRPTAPAGKYLSNMLVRQAIAYAIDYDRIIKFRDGERAYGLYHKGQCVPEVAVDAQKDFKYDPVKAKQLLTQAGYPNGIPDKLEMICCPDAYGAEEVEMATMIKSNLEAIGIPVNIRIVDAVLRITLINTGNSTLSLLSCAAIHPDPDDNAGVWYYSKGVAAARRFGLNRTDVDQLVLQGKAELDNKKKAEIYQRLQMICDGPEMIRGTICIYWPWNYVVAWKYVKGDMTPTIMQRYSLDWTQVDMDPERKIS